MMRAARAGISRGEPASGAHRPYFAEDAKRELPNTRQLAP